MMNTKPLIFLSINLLCLMAVVSPSLAQEKEKKKEKASKTINYTEKGRIQINTSTNFDFAMGNVDANIRYYGIEPTISAGYFVINNLMPQIGFSYSYTKIEGLRSDTARSSSGPDSYETILLGAQFGLTYYFWKTFFLTANYDISFNIGAGSSDSFGTFESGVGYALFFNRNVALTPSIQFGLPGHNSSPDTFDFQFNIGLSIYLTCPK